MELCERFTPPMEARLQHVMNVVHVTCAGHITTMLVEAKVDLGRESWADFRVPMHMRWWLQRENTGLCSTGRLLLSWWRGLEKVLRSPRNPYVPHGMTLRQRVSASVSLATLGRSVAGPTTALIVRRKATQQITNHQERFCQRKLTEDK